MLSLPTGEPHLGNDWLRDSCLPGGIFDNPRTQGTLKLLSPRTPLPHWKYFEKT